MICARAMWLSSVGLVLAVFWTMGQPGQAHDNTARDFACYSVDQLRVQFCVPQGQALIRMEVEDFSLYAHYESGLGGYNISIEQSPEDYSVPQDMEAGIAATYFGRRIAGVNPPGRARAFITYEDMAIIQIEGGDQETQIFVVEIHTPRQILRIEAIDYSIEFDSESQKFEKLRRELQYGVELAGQTLSAVLPLDSMEPFP